MSQGGVNIERQYLVRAADGTAYWDGLLLAGEIFEAVNAEASATVLAGETVRFDSANTTPSWPRWDLPSTSEPIKKMLPILRLSGSLNLLLPGVALENVPPGVVGRFAGKGSFVSTVCINPPNSNVVGSGVQSSATVGAVTANIHAGVYTANTMHVTPGLGVGFVCKPAGVGAANTGSLTQLGILVAPF